MGKRLLKPLAGSLGRKRCGLTLRIASLIISGGQSQHCYATQTIEDRTRKERVVVEKWLILTFV